MKSVEQFVKPSSNYFIYSPSKQGQLTFLYPTHTGLFHYEAGYAIKRQTYYSFLLMFVQKGSLSIEYNNSHFTATSGQVVLLNCFEPHSYSTTSDSSVLWLHFDGTVAKEYYNIITQDQTIVFSLADTFTTEQNLNFIYNTFHTGAPVKEALISKYITDILTSLILEQETSELQSNNAALIERIVGYINENLSHELTLDMLAEQASLSHYYFTRVFKKETGFTPYQYILSSRINHAKFLLKKTNLTIKEICFECGFSCESNFCFAFKKKEGFTPSDYRDRL